MTRIDIIKSFQDVSKAPLDVFAFGLALGYDIREVRHPRFVCATLEENDDERTIKVNGKMAEAMRRLCAVKMIGLAELFPDIARSGMVRTVRVNEAPPLIIIPKTGIAVKENVESVVTRFAINQLAPTPVLTVLSERFNKDVPSIAAYLRLPDDVIKFLLSSKDGMG